MFVVLVQDKWLVRSRLCLSRHGYGDRLLRQSHQLAGSGNLLSPPPPAEKATACQDQRGNSANATTVKAKAC
jgi:hypothetical protein